MSINMKKVLAGAPVVPQGVHLDHINRLATFAGQPQFLLEPVALNVPYGMLKAVAAQILVAESNAELAHAGVKVTPDKK